MRTNPQCVDIDCVRGIGRAVQCDGAFAVGLAVPLIGHALGEVHLHVQRNRGVAAEGEVRSGVSGLFDKHRVKVNAAQAVSLEVHLIIHAGSGAPARLVHLIEDGDVAGLTAVSLLCDFCKGGVHEGIVILVLTAGVNLGCVHPLQGLIAVLIDPGDKNLAIQAGTIGIGITG